MLNYIFYKNKFVKCLVQKCYFLEIYCKKSLHNSLLMPYGDIDSGQY